MDVIRNKAPLERKRGPARQRQLRELERSLRIKSLAFVRWAERLGVSQAEAAQLLKLSTATVGHWVRRWRTDHLTLAPYGRPVHVSDLETRQLIVGLFSLVGPGIGLPCLRHFFPDASKGELEDMLRRYRKLHHQRDGKVLLHVLRWLKPGTVWAMDFHKPRPPVDGIYPYVFIMRDLASGNQLLCLPVPDRQLRHVADALASLFKQHGAPLVLKSDNEFDTGRPPATLDPLDCAPQQQLAEVLEEHGVIPLLSPPAMPEYNASIEAGIGSFQTRAHLEAARNGHPEEWNCDDVEAARLQANELARPWGHTQHTPDQAWRKRLPIISSERQAFATSVQQFEYEARLEKEEDRRKQELFDNVPLSRRDLASIRRVAISRALVAHGMLSFKRRRFTLPIRRHLWSNVS
jgi:hypothetical protein